MRISDWSSDVCSSDLQWLQTLDAYVFPNIGHVQVHEITGPMIRNLLSDIWLAKPETARRVRQRIGTVLDWAYASGYRESEAPRRAITKGKSEERRVGKEGCSTLRSRW